MGHRKAQSAVGAAQPRGFLFGRFLLVSAYGSGQPSPSFAQCGQANWAPLLDSGNVLHRPGPPTEQDPCLPVAEAGSGAACGTGAAGRQLLEVQEMLILLCFVFCVAGWFHSNTQLPWIMFPEVLAHKTPAAQHETRSDFRSARSLAVYWRSMCLTCCKTPLAFAARSSACARSLSASLL